MARPKKQKELRKEKLITVRLTDVEYEIIAENAKRAGKPIAEFVRDQAVHREVKIIYPIVVDLPELQPLTDQFQRIGDNLNQIAKYFNMKGLHSMAVRQEINACIMMLMDLRKEVLKLAGDFRGYWNME
ncbi:MAG: plasmid mobilization relaxosome protein MobC [Oscillospiraceae bacterium]|nr:plasmid mobilization relaxosome protein MobC [Oscillospiraceae bacterium]